MSTPIGPVQKHAFLYERMSEDEFVDAFLEWQFYELQSHQDRNDKCSCGSGKKYKHCTCRSKWESYPRMTPFKSSWSEYQAREYWRFYIKPRIQADSVSNSRPRKGLLAGAMMMIHNTLNY
jgi:hypothetical protein